MAKNPVSDGTTSIHQLIAKERKDLEIAGVIEICAFDETQVYLKTSCGSMRINGKSLRVTSLLPEENKAVIEGTIDGISYTGRKSSGNLFRKLLK